ncbi:MAG: hypothetical protein KGM16_07035 [Bacteroidota bacterium]|nr:hypothetical protein [Bacteroidota bacterium]
MFSCYILEGIDELMPLIGNLLNRKATFAHDEIYSFRNGNIGFGDELNALRR